MIQVREIPNYEGIYEAHSDGTVWTCKGKTTYRKMKNGKLQKRVWKQRMLKAKIEKRMRSSQHDLRLELYKNGFSKTWLVSRLIAMAFIPNPIGLPCVNHINGNPLDNNPHNLEWCSYSHNVIHAYKNGLNHTPNKIEIFNVVNKTKKRFYNMSKASEYIGKNHGYVSQLLKDGKSRVDDFEIKVL